jgi:hypothetical protein
MQRLQLASQVVGLNMAFFEIQRAGVKPADGDATVPQVWAWKKPAYTNICKTYQRQFMTTTQTADANLKTFPGYFEAGSVLLGANSKHTARERGLVLLQWACTVLPTVLYYLHRVNVEPFLTTGEAECARTTLILSHASSQACTGGVFVQQRSL